MFLMNRTIDTDQTKLFSKTYDVLSLRIRIRLLNDLNVNDYNDGKTILPYYILIIFSKILKNVVYKLLS